VRAIVSCLAAPYDEVMGVFSPRKMLMLGALSITACAGALKLLGLPPEATRNTPPVELASKALQVGASAPNFELPSTIGKVSLAALLSQGRVVLVFYRGQW
jgi:hypothetical protein